MLSELIFKDIKSDANPSPKPARCEFCRKAPSEGKRLHACAQCQAVVYCSRECQKKHWKTHKLPCSKGGCYLRAVRKLDRVKAAEHEAESMPPLEQRLTLFIDFLKAHSFILARAMEAAVYGAHGGPEAFDFDRTYLLIALAYRGDCAGNPARAFSVECIDLIRYNPAKYTDDVHKNLEARRARLDGECGNRSLGSLRIMYRTAERHPEEDFKRWDVQPIFKPARARGFCIPMPPVAQQLCGDKRCSELMSASEHGLVVRHDTNEDRGPHWRWVRLTPTQLRDRGLPAVFNDSRKFDLQRTRQD
ncbi:hypothetical protein FOMPIDRAFT_1018398 [Fomitopsis schrenkii]|uniref:MYND-type domain-containing protein n=1 Tax=Fomitopsis schrenkii TaxID=2126942 RepID=S8FFJ6_FOMSC|nr:hypothetical protein FOMPIDRAFT_1018398 [Fomitopsis schrenkii]